MLSDNWTVLSCHLDKIKSLSKTFEPDVEVCLPQTSRRQESSCSLSTCSTRSGSSFCREYIYQRCQSRELRTYSVGFFLHADLETHASLENVQLDLVWSVLLRKVWPKIFLTRRLSLDSNNRLLLLDVGFGFGFWGFFPCFLITCVTKSSTQVSLLLISWSLVLVLWL